MIRALLVSFILASGVDASPHPDYERAIVKKMRERYDFPVLTVFLKKVVEEHPKVETVSIASTKVEARWRFESVDPPSRMRSGDWVIWDTTNEDGSFDLYYQFESTRSVTIRAKRLSRDKFELIGISIDEWVSLK
jgi:hypothetical protein